MLKLLPMYTVQKGATISENDQFYHRENHSGRNIIKIDCHVGYENVAIYQIFRKKLWRQQPS